ncbi:hypothetical protein GJ744_005381 [Endocarpon pusillum]|uniref:Uncharacterized protein n=1 Tax=Endocarpon pusillum TaxID=364733 RepID=A0A8H7E7E7_9EURO|nr:hypothetical protein GJ744_005381 [Endocarpon pusillum]
MVMVARDRQIHEPDPTQGRGGHGMFSSFSPALPLATVSSTSVATPPIVPIILFRNTNFTLHDLGPSPFLLPGLALFCHCHFG